MRFLGAKRLCEITLERVLLARHDEEDLLHGTKLRIVQRERGARPRSHLGGP